MKFLSYRIYLCSILFMIFGCVSNKKPNYLYKRANIDYLQSKSEFEKWMINHFPDSTLENDSFFFSNSISRRSKYLYLCRRNVSSIFIKTLKENLFIESIAKYNSNQSNLLIINRFKYTLKENERIFLTSQDSIFLDSNLFHGLYPVPNFYELKKGKDLNGIWLPKGFDLYVLEAKSGDYCTEFELKENFQMPKGWKNGFSRGVAINEKERTVIYWGIIW